MGSIVREWILQYTGDSVHIESLEEDMRNGYALGVLLHALQHMTDGNRRVLKDRDEDDTVKLNFTLVRGALMSLGLRLPGRVVGDIVSGHRGAAAALVLQIKSAHSNSTGRSSRDSFYKKAIHSVRPRAPASRAMVPSRYARAAQEVDVRSFSHVDMLVHLERFADEQKHNDERFDARADEARVQSAERAVSRRRHELDRRAEKRKFFEEWMGDGRQRWRESMRHKHALELRDLQYEQAIQAVAEQRSKAVSAQGASDACSGISKFEAHLGRLGLCAMQERDEPLKPSYETREVYLKRITLAAQAEHCTEDGEKLLEQLRKRTHALKVARHEKERRRRKEVVEQSQEAHRVQQAEAEERLVARLESNTDRERHAAQLLYKKKLERRSHEQDQAQITQEKVQAQAIQVEASIAAFCNRKEHYAAKMSDRLEALAQLAAAREERKVAKHQRSLQLGFEIANDVISFVLDVIAAKHEAQREFIASSQYAAMKKAFIHTSRPVIPIARAPKADVGALAEANFVARRCLLSGKIIHQVEEGASFQAPDPLQELHSLLQQVHGAVDAYSNAPQVLPPLDATCKQTIRQRRLSLAVTCEGPSRVWLAISDTIRAWPSSTSEAIDLPMVATPALRLFNEKDLLQSILDSEDVVVRLAELTALSSLVSASKACGAVVLSEAQKQEIGALLEEFAHLGSRLQSIVELAASSSSQTEASALIEHLSDVLLSALFGRFLKLRQLLYTMLGGSEAEEGPAVLLLGFPTTVLQLSILQITCTSQRTLNSIADEIVGLKEDQSSSTTPLELIQAFKADRALTSELAAQAGQQKWKQAAKRKAERAVAPLANWDRTVLHGIIHIHSTAHTVGDDERSAPSTPPDASDVALWLQECCRLRQARGATVDDVSRLKQKVPMVELSEAGDVLDEADGNGHTDTKDTENLCATLETVQSAFVAFHSSAEQSTGLVQSVLQTRETLRAALGVEQRLALLHACGCHPLDESLRRDAEELMVTALASQQDAIAVFMQESATSLRLLEAVMMQYPSRLEAVLLKNDSRLTAEYEQAWHTCANGLLSDAVSTQHMIYELEAQGADRIDELHRSWLRVAQSLVDDLQLFTSATLQQLEELAVRSTQALVSCFHSAATALAAYGDLLSRAGYTCNPSRTVSLRRRVRKAHAYYLARIHERAVYASLEAVLEGFPARVRARGAETSAGAQLVAQETELVQLSLLQRIDGTLAACEELYERIHSYVQHFQTWASDSTGNRVRAEYENWEAAINQLRALVSPHTERLAAAITGEASRHPSLSRPLQISTRANSLVSAPAALVHVALALKRSAKGKAHLRAKSARDTILQAAFLQQALFSQSWRDSKLVMEPLVQMQSAMGVPWKSFIMQMIFRSVSGLPSIQYLVQLVDDLLHHPSTTPGSKGGTRMPATSFLECMRSKLWWTSLAWLDSANLSPEMTLELYSRGEARTGDNAQRVLSKWSHERKDAVLPVRAALCTSSEDACAALECLAHTYSDHNGNVVHDELLMDLCLCYAPVRTDTALTNFLSSTHPELPFDMGLYKAWCVASRVGGDANGAAEACTTPWVVHHTSGSVGPILSRKQLEWLFSSMHQPLTTAHKIWEAITHHDDSRSRKHRSTVASDSEITFSDLLLVPEGLTMLSVQCFRLHSSSPT